MNRIASSNSPPYNARPHELSLEQSHIAGHTTDNTRLATVAVSKAAHIQAPIHLVTTKSTTGSEIAAIDSTRTNTHALHVVATRPVDGDIAAPANGEQRLEQRILI